MFAGSPAERAYRELAPDPGGFPVLVEKLVALLSTPHGWSADAIRAIRAPTLIIVGDADVVRLEHAVELFRLRGGGAIGDFAELPDARWPCCRARRTSSRRARASWTARRCSSR